MLIDNIEKYMYWIILLVRGLYDMFKLNEVRFFMDSMCLFVKIMDKNYFIC